MLDPEHARKICTEYALGEYASSERITDGVLNHNYLVITSTGKYFVKSVRKEVQEKIEMVHNGELLMKSHGIPAITMLKTTSDALWITGTTELFTVYPYIEALKTFQLSSNEHFVMGEMLGNIHKVGGEKVSADLHFAQAKKPDKETTIQKLQEYKAAILKKDNRDETDDLFLTYIDMKCNAVANFPEIMLASDTLTHGDYHPGNILFNTNKKIIGICDWEKIEYAPRSYELARAILFSCFPENNSYERSLEDARTYIRGYRKIIDISQEEIIDGLKLRIYRTMLSKWIEQKYYFFHDDRANQFILHDMYLIDLALNKKLIELVNQ